MRLSTAVSLRRVVLCSFASAGLLLAGCAGGKLAGPTGGNIESVSGKVHGGNSPVQGALVELWHTNPAATTYGAPGIQIGTALTDGNGFFNIGSNSGSAISTANCPAGSMAYITAAGGYQPGHPATINNNMLQIAALGDCSTVNSNTSVVIDEVTTVAAAYALSGFMSTGIDGANNFYTAYIGAPAANNAAIGSATATTPSGLAHAFLNAAKLANVSTGLANATTTAYSGGVSIYGSVPAVEINTLADMMQACVNTTSGSGGGVNAIPVSNGGSGYGAALTITGGVGSGATGNAIVSSSGVVTGLAITNPGSGYSPTLTISGNGSGAQLVTTLSGGALTGATVENGGSGYGAIATVTPSTGYPNGSGVVLAVSSSAGVPSSYSVLSGGSGYGPLVTVSAPPYGGTTAAVNAQIGTSVDPGGVSQLSLVSGGSGYGPLVSISAASGSGAVIAATLSGTGGAVTALAVTSSGSGYPASTSIPLTIQAPPNGGTTATGLANTSATGTISSVVLTGGGSGYTLPTLAISAPPGGGTAAVGTVTSVKAGAVLGLSITTGGNGTGYTMPTVTITGTGTGGNAYVSTVTGGAITSVIAGKFGVSGTAGSGYGPVLTVQAPPSGGTQATATASLIAGTISLVSITSAGSGYSPTVTITGGATNATGTATIAGGAITALNLATAGSGYSVPTVTVAAPTSGGTTATATATTAGGVVSAINVTSEGSGYTSAPAVTISAPSAGIQAVAGTPALTADASTGNTAPASLCNTLFTLTSSISGVLPSNTLQAYINLARNPYPSAAAMNASTGLFSLLSGSPAFQPTLLSTGLPADWSLAILYGTTASGNATSLAVPYWLATDANDTVYLSRSSTSTTLPLLYGVSAYGATPPLFANSPVGTSGRGIAVDQLGSIWEVTNSTGLMQLNASTGALTNTYTTAASSSTDVKVDAANNVWVSNAVAPGTNLEEFAYTSGTSSWALSNTASLPAGGNGIGIDANQNVWGTAYSTSGGTTIATYATVLANTGTAAAPNYSPSSGVITPVEALFGGGAAKPFGVVFDASGNAWYDIYGTGATTTSGVEEVVPNSTTALTSIAPGELILGSTTNPNGNQLGTANPSMPSIDGAGTIFIPDTGIFATPVTYGLHIYSTVTGNTLSPANGITGCLLATSSTTTCATTTAGAIYEPHGAVVDSTGSVWVGQTSTGGVSQIIGVAAPTYPVLSIGKPGLSPGLTAMNPLP
jgi:hypothetical protein